MPRRLPFFGYCWYWWTFANLASFTALMCFVPSYARTMEDSLVKLCVFSMRVLAACLRSWEKWYWSNLTKQGILAFSNVGEKGICITNEAFFRFWGVLRFFVILMSVRKFAIVRFWYWDLCIFIRTKIIVAEGWRLVTHGVWMLRAEDIFRTCVCLAIKL